MAWYGSTRASRLPHDWPERRATALHRDRRQCQATEHHPDCDRTATDVDHIIPGDDHSLANLQSLSEPCHRAKTATETAQRNEANAKMRKRPERHPGAL